jgi:hypothetical protein
MTNRRDFLQTGAAVSALAMNGLLPAHAVGAAAASSKPPLHEVLYDDRYAEGRLFAATTRQHGVPARALDDGDPTGLWHGGIDLQWRAAAAVVGGITQDGPLLVLQQLARDCGMRMALRVAHRPNADGTLAHLITAPRETIMAARTLGAARLEWPALFAILACRCAAAVGPPETFVLATPGARPALRMDRPDERPSLIHYYTPRRLQEGYGVDIDGPLNSWVLAPVRQA